jgi:branched-chain amino acid transport system substrate-binding protein
MNPNSHHLQQTIYMARRNPNPTDRTDLFKIVAWTSPKDVEDSNENTACKLESYQDTPTVEP